MKKPQVHIPRADTLAHLWWNYRKANPKHQVVAIGKSQFAALERHMRRLPRDSSPRRLTNLVIGADARYHPWLIDDELWAPSIRPSERCTCPDGSGSARRIHGIRERLKMVPTPRSKYDCDPKCPFCGVKGIAFEPYRCYDYPYGFTAEASMSILLLPPPPDTARWLSYGSDRPLAHWACEELQSPDADNVLRVIEGEIDPCSLPLDDRERILVALRQSHHLTHERILRERARKDSEFEQVDLAYQNNAMHFVIPIWTNACYFPENNDYTDSKCLRPVFTKKLIHGRPGETRLRLYGNFATHADYYQDWLPHLVPLGASPV